MLTGVKLSQENMDPSNFDYHESVIDSDEEDLGESIESFRDAVRDCLETDPAARSEEDIGSGGAYHPPSHQGAQQAELL